MSMLEQLDAVLANMPEGSTKHDMEPGFEAMAQWIQSLDSDRRAEVLSELPDWLQVVSQFLPLGAAVNLVRPLILGAWPATPLADLAILLTYCIGGFYLATMLTRKRLLK